MAQNYDDGRSMNSRSSREQVESAMERLRLNSKLIAQPIDTGNSELLLYAFRVKRSQTTGSEPRQPATSSRWMDVPTPREEMQERNHGGMNGERIYSKLERK